MNKELGFTQMDWSPLFSNDYKTPLDANSPSTNTSPCYHTGYRMADGQVRLGAQLHTLSGTSTVHVTNDYDVRAVKDEQSKWVQVDQAMYLDRAAGQEGNLRVIVALDTGKDRIFTAPVSPYKTFYSAGSSDDQKIWRNGGCDKNGCQLASVPISYAVLIWNVHGKDIAIALHQGPTNKKFYGFIRLVTTGICNPGTDYCGNIQFHARVVDSEQDPTQQRSFTKGVVDTFGLDYEIGTLEQLKALGYAWSK